MRLSMRLKSLLTMIE